MFLIKLMHSLQCILTTLISAGKIKNLGGGIGANSGTEQRFIFSELQFPP